MLIILGKGGGSIPSVFGAGILLARPDVEDAGQIVAARGGAVKLPFSW